MKVINNLAYHSDEMPWHHGDLYLPAQTPAPIALCIHGGGWSSMDRTSFAGVAEFICSQGWAAFNIDYRLLGTAPWPACGDDCLSAAEFLLRGANNNPLLDCSKLLVVGASAGGHLALMTGLRLPRHRVSAIVSIAGVTDLSAERLGECFTVNWKSFFGHEPSPDEIKKASPVELISHTQAPVLCTHFPGDIVVGVEHSRKFTKACQTIGAQAVLFEYQRPLDGHSIWIPDSNPHRLFPEIEKAIADFVQSHVDSK